MKFRSQIFWSFLLISTLMLAALMGTAYFGLRNALESQFIERYQSLAHVTGDTLVQLENTTDLINRSAAHHLFSLEQTSGLPSEQKLLDLKKDLHVSMIYIADKTGRFVRGTEETPDKRPKSLFMFCEGYRGLLTGITPFESTPILPSYHPQYPYKFFMIPNHNRTRILEVGVLLNFIGEVLRKAVQSDKGIVNIGLYSPKGFNLGFIPRDGKTKPHEPLQTIPNMTPGVVTRGPKTTVFVTRVAASAEYCCECIIKNVVGADGKYYYLLRLEVSNDVLDANLRTLQKLGLIFFALAALAAVILSRQLSHRLARRLYDLSAGVNKIMTTNDLSIRLKVSGHDEIAELGVNINRMAESLESHRRTELESQRAKLLADLAAQVAHDIRSPLAALEAILENIGGFPEEMRILIRQATTRIKDIANDLLTRNKIISKDESKSFIDSGFLLSGLVESVVSEKRIQYIGLSKVEIRYELTLDSYSIFVAVDPVELKRSISNLINNAVEALPDKGNVTVTLVRQGVNSRLDISDNGKGIPEALMSKIMQRGTSFGKQSGSGLGLSYAKNFAEKSGGSVEIVSSPQQGTTVSLLLPTSKPASWFTSEIAIHPSDVIVVVDDDPGIHNLWKQRFLELGLEQYGIDTRFFTSTGDFLKWKHETNTPRTSHNGGLVLLCDYEFTNERLNGLELIIKNDLVHASYLVTSRFEEIEVFEKCNEFCVKMIPKGLARFVPINLSPAPLTT